MTVKRALAVCLASAALVGAPACQKERGSTGGGDAGGEGGARSYALRAEIVQLPAGPGPAQLTLRHEAIPDFVDRSGTAVGMAAMVMALDLAPGVSLDHMQVGDKVEARLVVDWARPSARIEGLRALPPGTQLHFDPRPHADAGRP